MVNKHKGRHTIEAVVRVEFSGAELWEIMAWKDASSSTTAGTFGVGSAVLQEPQRPVFPRFAKGMRLAVPQEGQGRINPRVSKDRECVMLV